MRANEEYRQLQAENEALKALIEDAYSEGEGVIMSDTWAASTTARRLKKLTTQEQAA